MSTTRLLLFVFCLTVASAHAQNADSIYLREHYYKREMMIPMRDGVRLFTSVYLPKDQTRQYPIVLRRTPYSCAPYGAGAFTDRMQNMAMVRAGYIFVIQDVRGRYMSEGEFMDIRPFNPDKKTTRDTDEASDTYDTVDWLVKNLPNNNGRVGVWGISYPGFYATMCILANHPAIKAVSPQAPVTNWFVGDDFHHNGAFMLMDAFSFYSGFGKPRPAPTMDGAPGFSDWKTPDNYAFYLRVGALRNFTEQLGMKNIPFWNDLMAHPDYDAWWKARDPRPHLKNVQPAVLTVGGLFDAEDCWGAWNLYKAIESQNASAVNNQLVMGPWVHGGWARTDGDRLGNVVFGQKTSVFYQDNIELPFFEYYLKDKGPATLPEASIFLTGANRWARYDQWPPRTATPVQYFFHSDNSLSTTPTNNAENWLEYVSDPAHPVPYTEDVHLGRTREYMCDDQRFASRRPDVLTFQTAPLGNEMILAGPVSVDLWVSTTGTDADFVVKLIDVFPDTLQGSQNGVPLGGYQMLVRGEIFRGRYRNGFDKPEPFIPGQPAHVVFELPDVAHVILPGHRLMVQVQSSWFPLSDRNPQQFVNIYEAKDADFKKATHRLYCSPGQASFIRLPVQR